MEWTAEQLAPQVNVFAVIVIKSTTLTMSSPKKFTAEHQSASARCSRISPFLAVKTSSANANTLAPFTLLMVSDNARTHLTVETLAKAFTVCMRARVV